MKKFITIILIISIAFFSISCGDPKIIDGKLYDTYGLANQNNKHNPNIQYELIIGNVIWSVILIETIIAPIYFIGFSLYEPVALKKDFEPGVIK